MPNWCSTNYLLRGDKEELEEFANMLNTMPNNENGFGRYWIGNLLISLGFTDEDIMVGRVYCGGTFDPNPHARAYFGGLDVDENEEFKVGDDGKMRFSVISPWSRIAELENHIKKRFPSFEFSWTSTDEFGNFHLVHDPYGEMERFVLITERGWEYYNKDDFERFRSDLIMACKGLGIHANATKEYLASNRFVNKFIRWRYRAKGNKLTGFAIYRES